MHLSIPSSRVVRCWLHGWLFRSKIVGKLDGIGTSDSRRKRTDFKSLDSLQQVKGHHDLGGLLLRSTRCQPQVSLRSASSSELDCFPAPVPSPSSPGQQSPCANEGSRTTMQFCCTPSRICALAVLQVGILAIKNASKLEEIPPWCQGGMVLSRISLQSQQVLVALPVEDGDLAASLDGIIFGPKNAS